VSGAGGSTDHNGYRQAAGDEPLPGYRLTAALGRGGFGEVWKCEAPGGLHKAVKFVYPDSDGGSPGDSLRQEFEAFQQIKAIRHPFLLTLERVELVRGTLVMVMELADQHLHDRYRECVAGGHPGIPRDELIGYLADAAEALDLISARHGLQHLDVKPANLFLVSGRAKVGDYGLVSRSQQGDGGDRRNGGFTPRYAPPELIDGRVHPRSDQYSLALVYFELLTGRFPWDAKSANDLIMMHAAVEPNLDPLPPADRPVVARALAKDPADRFPNCMGLVRALLAAGPDAAGDLSFRIVRRSGVIAMPPNQAVGSTTLRRPGGQTLPGGHTLPTPVTHTGMTVPLRTPGMVSGASGVQLAGPHVLRTPLPPDPGPSQALAQTMVASPFRPTDPATPPAEDEGLVRLTPTNLPMPVARLVNGFRSVLPVPVLAGRPDPGADLPTAGKFAFDLFEQVCKPGPLPRTATDPVRLADGSWTCRFPARVTAATVPFKLAVLKEQYKAEVAPVEFGVFRLRMAFLSRGGWLRKGEPHGLEVSIQVPPPTRPDGDVLAVGRTFGPVDKALLGLADTTLPRLLSDIRGLLQNLPDRRKAPRVPYDGPLFLYPVDEDGAVFPTVSARGVDISPTGLCCLPDGQLHSQYVYAEFPRIAKLAGLAALVELIRKRSAATSGSEVAGLFRVDLDDSALVPGKPAEVTRR
jgi:serine/threonine protein kinase